MDEERVMMSEGIKTENIECKSSGCWDESHFTQHKLVSNQKFVIHKLIPNLL